MTRTCVRGGSYDVGMGDDASLGAGDDTSKDGQEGHGDAYRVPSHGHGLLRAPWQPGERPAGAGKPAVVYAAEHLARAITPEQLSAHLAGELRPGTVHELIAYNLAAIAAGLVHDARPIDQVKAAAEVMDRTSGKPAQQVIVTPTAAPVDGRRLLDQVRAELAGELPPPPPPPQNE